MKVEKVIQLEDRVPKIKQYRRKKGSRRFILYVSILFLIVLCLIYFRSPISKITNISVEGNHYMNKDEVLKYTNITYDSSYFRISSSKAEEALEKRSEVKRAIVTKKIPNKIIIRLQEYNTIGYIKKEDTLLPLLENGTILQALQQKELPVAAPILVSFDKKEMFRKLSVELTKLSPDIRRSISEIQSDPQPLDEGHITLYMNEGYQVSATLNDFSKKMEIYPFILKQIKPGTKVIIHLEVGAYIETIDGGGKAK